VLSGDSTSQAFSESHTDLHLISAQLIPPQYFSATPQPRSNRTSTQLRQPEQNPSNPAEQEQPDILKGSHGHNVSTGVLIAANRCGFTELALSCSVSQSYDIKLPVHQLGLQSSTTDLHFISIQLTPPPMGRTRLQSDLDSYQFRQDPAHDHRESNFISVYIESQSNLLHVPEHTRPTTPATPKARKKELSHYSRTSKCKVNIQRTPTPLFNNFPFNEGLLLVRKQRQQKSPTSRTQVKCKIHKVTDHLTRSLLYARLIFPSLSQSFQAPMIASH